MICKNCKYRDVCTEICDENSAYVEQDQAYAREIPVSQLKIDVEQNDNEIIDLINQLSSNYTEEITSFDFLTDFENQIISLFFLQSKTYAEIAARMSIGNRYGYSRKLSSKAVERCVARSLAKFRGVLTYNRGDYAI